MNDKKRLDEILKLSEDIIDEKMSVLMERQKQEDQNFLSDLRRIST